ncbi:MAG: hypothetical protein PHR98_03445 [Candidatus Shapirobacteria bacterium]|jgi:hypothetical protein|nr:hypothetical protein [Candidatus Shapirobacteria bacterium]
MENKEIVAIQPVCLTCGWKGERYDVLTDGTVDCAMASAIIETRLGHLLETRGKHQIEYLKIESEVSSV